MHPFTEYCFQKEKHNACDYKENELYYVIIQSMDDVGIREHWIKNP